MKKMQIKGIFMKRMIITVISLTLCIIVLNACIQSNNQPQADSERKTNTKDAPEKVISSYEEYENTKYPLIAADPENNIRLYGVKPQGVVLCKDGIEQSFDWSYITPRGILPEIETADFDGDGIYEIGVNLYRGSGTGMSIEQLHIVKPEKDNAGKDCFANYQFMEDDYAAQLTEILQYTYDSETQILTIQIYD